MKQVLAVLWCAASWSVSYWLAGQADASEFNSVVRAWLCLACLTTVLNPFAVLLVSFVELKPSDDPM